MKIKACVAAVVMMGGMALAQDLGVKAPPQERPVVIAGATVHPVSGPVIEQGHVVFDRGIITAVGSGPAPSGITGATVIDGAGKHIYPGLFGANTQMGLVEINAVRATVDYAEIGAITPEVRAAVAVNPDSTIIPVTRTNGVLTVGVLPMGGAVPGRASVIAMDGWTWEDMAVDDDAGVVVNWPSMRPARGWWVTKSEDEQAEETRQALDQIDRAFLAAGAYIKAKAADAAVPTDVRWEAMRGVLERGDPVFIRAEELEQIMSAVSWAALRGVKPVIVGGRDASMCLDMLKKHDAAVIVTGTFRLPRRADSDYDELYRLPALLQEAGVRWCLATTGGSFETPHERNLPYHAGMAVAFGLDPEAALRAITLSPAELMGVGARVGSIESGKDATIIITDGNPLEVTTMVERAFVRGREIDLSNKQTKLDEKYREKYRQLGVKRE